MRQFLSRLVKYKKKTKKEDFFFPQLSSKCSVDSSTVSPVMSFVLSSRPPSQPNDRAAREVALLTGTKQLYGSYYSVFYFLLLLDFYDASCGRNIIMMWSASPPPPMYYQLVRRKTCCSGHSYILYMGRGCSFRIVRMWYYVFKR